MKPDQLFALFNGDASILLPSRVGTLYSALIKRLRFLTEPSTNEKRLIISSSSEPGGKVSASSVSYTYTNSYVKLSSCVGILSRNRLDRIQGLAWRDISWNLRDGPAGGNHQMTIKLRNHSRIKESAEKKYRAHGKLLPDSYIALRAEMQRRMVMYLGKTVTNDHIRNEVLGQSRKRCLEEVARLKHAKDNQVEIQDRVRQARKRSENRLVTNRKRNRSLDRLRDLNSQEAYSKRCNRYKAKIEALVDTNLREYHLHKSRITFAQRVLTPPIPEWRIRLSLRRANEMGRLASSNHGVNDVTKNEADSSLSIQAETRGQSGDHVPSTPNKVFMKIPGICL